MKAFIFDLDGTLVDSVYPHTLAWQKSLSDFALPCPAWGIHHRIGMSGELLVKTIAREQGRTLSDSDIKQLSERHMQVSQASPRLQPVAGRGGTARLPGES
jgi:beta-phosphoglucomutase-like phosphatase (HAD superfamily)